MKISIVIPTYNRTTLLYASYEQVKHDPRISEIVIVDDCSKPEIWAELQEHMKYEPKVKLFRNEKNLGVYDNKRMAVEKASEEWVVLLDSDNVIGLDYIDRLYLLPQNFHEWNETMIYAPEFARPHFDYRKFSAHLINRQNVRKHAGKPGFDCCMNTMNYFVNRMAFLLVWRPRENILGADSIYFNFLWLSAGNEIYIVPGLQYDHLVHSGTEKESGSNYQRYAAESEPMCRAILQDLKNMR